MILHVKSSSRQAQLLCITYLINLLGHRLAITVNGTHLIYDLMRHLYLASCPVKEGNDVIH